MRFSAENIAYKHTGSFSKIVLDYLDNADRLRPFYNYRPDKEGIKKAVTDRKQFPVNRKLLHSVIGKQYAGMKISGSLKANIDQLLNENTFTVCTAHQPNIFTGHLYFIYKILHAVRLSAELNTALPEYNFVPVYYMGSEDADLAELGEVNINGKRYQWNTPQQGAVGRMKIDRAFLKIIDEIEGQLSVEKSGAEIIAAIRKAYTENTTVEKATFDFVHALFNEFGLVILLPDNASLKQEFAPVIKKELQEQFSHNAVSHAAKAFPSEYKVQAAGREINLFYLEKDTRERIEQKGNTFSVNNTGLSFTTKELDALADEHPERFSPNVILRPVFQEMILPDVAFIGGGGELAYWLELKGVFEAANAFFPVLVLRNSFSVVQKNIAEKMMALGLVNSDGFRPEAALLETIIKTFSEIKLNLNSEKEELRLLFEKIKIVADKADATLRVHVQALHTQALQRLEKLEKKMLKAEKKKFAAQERQLHKIKNALYPGGILQERSDNILPYLAVYGKEILNIIYENSGALQQEFTILTES